MVVVLVVEVVEVDVEVNVEDGAIEEKERVRPSPAHRGTCKPCVCRWVRQQVVDVKGSAAEEGKELRSSLLHIW